MRELTVGSLFSGVGLLDYGLHLAGVRHRWFCESDKWRRSILAKRWPGIAVHDDARSVGADNLERVDIVAGGFPCKGASNLGWREGFDHPETALWAEQARVIGELRPRYAVVENVAAILGLHRGNVWGQVLGDMATLGYDCWWDCFPAAAFGAPHGRDRVFLVAYSKGDVADAPNSENVGLERVGSPRRRRNGSSDGGDVTSDPRSERRRQDPRGAHGDEETNAGWAEANDYVARGAGAGELSSTEWGPYKPAVRRWEAIFGRPSPEPVIRRVDDGGPRRVVRPRLSALGDGVLVQAGWLVGRMIVDHHATQSAQAV